jgi:hypothetical protein
VDQPRPSDRKRFYAFPNDPMKVKTQAEILIEVRKLLSDHFDCGIAIVAWEEQGTTYHMECKFGNEYAVQALAKQAETFFEEEIEEEEEA